MKKCIFVCMVCLMASCNSEQAAIQVVNPRCELLTDPLGIDIEAPRLSWEITGDVRGIRQTAYRILVASSLEKLNADEGDLWDSKTVKSGASINVPYGGKKL